MKFKKVLLSLAVACLPAIGLAKPAYPGILTVENPDGTSVDVRLFGNEHFSIMTDASGEKLLKYNEKGFVVPYVRNGRQLMNTAQTRAMLQAEEQALPEVQAMRAMGMGPQKSAALKDDGRTSFPSVGEVRTLVVLVEYADIKFVTKDPQKEFDRLLNEEGYNLYDHPGSARDFYIDSSNGKFKPHFDVSRVVTLPMSSAYYCGANGKHSNFPAGLKYAIEELADEIDFSHYDADDDGQVDLVYVIYAGYGQADSSMPGTIWPHQGSMGFAGPTVNGKSVQSYACSSELRGGRHVKWKDNCLDGIGSIVHEYGHALGLPDLYDPNYNPACTTPDKWTTMDSGTYNGDGACPPMYSSYEKWMLRWLEYEYMLPGNKYTLPALSPENGKAHVMTAYGPFSDEYFKDEYFVFETRSKNQRWDSELPGEGLIIWHIDYDKSTWINNRVNSVPDRPRICTVPAIKGDYYQPQFPGRSNRHWISADDEFFIVFNDYKQAMPVNISNIEFNSNKGVSSLEYEVRTEGPQCEAKITGASLLPFPEDGFTITWECDDPSVEYLVTASFKSASTDTYITQDGVPLQNYLLGHRQENKLMIKGLSNLVLRSEVTVTITPFNGLPGKPSEPFTFVPNDLDDGEEYDANFGPGEIDDIVSDDNAVIYGGRGEIIAPAGAKIFNLHGERTAATGLSAGVYVVRYGSKTTKVVVR